MSSYINTQEIPEVIETSWYLHPIAVFIEKCLTLLILCDHFLL